MVRGMWHGGLKFKGKGTYFTPIRCAYLMPLNAVIADTPTKITFFFFFFLREDIGVFASLSPELIFVYVHQGDM